MGLLRLLCSCLDLPAGGVEFHGIAEHTGLEGFSDHGNETGLCLFVQVGENAAERAQAGEVADQLALGEGAFEIQWFDADVMPVRSFKKAFHTFGVCECELPGGVRGLLWQRDDGFGRPGGSGHEGGFLRGAPGHEQPGGVCGSGTPQVLELSLIHI